MTAGSPTLSRKQLQDRVMYQAGARHFYQEDMQPIPVRSRDELPIKVGERRSRTQAHVPAELCGVIRRNGAPTPAWRTSTVCLHYRNRSECGRR
jgi:hypothetical protein